MMPIAVQMGLFGEPNQLDGYHLVAAHVRTRADGAEVFVGEHLRWNPQRVGRRGRVHAEPPPDGQVPLFGA